MRAHLIGYSEFDVSSSGPSPQPSPGVPGEGVRVARFSRRTAFSLVEFTAVLALMAIVAGIVTISVRPLMVKGKQDAVRAEIGNICVGLEAFYGVYGRYPTNEEGLDVLRQKTDRLSEPLLTGDPVDPWGREYQYNEPGPDGLPYEVVCFGADGREGGDGAGADIHSAELKDVERK